MASIKLTLDATTFSGQIVTFTAPCSCAEAANELIINNDTYAVVDAMGNAITNDSNAWGSGALVTVTLDVTNKKAYLQNTTVLKHTHTAAEVGAVSKNGDTMTGDLAIKKSLPSITLSHEIAGCDAQIVSGTNNVNIRTRNAEGVDTNHRRITIFNSAEKADNSRAVLFQDIVGDVTSSFAIYGEHNDYVVKKSGDTMSNSLNITNQHGTLNLIIYEKRAFLRSLTDENNYGDINVGISTLRHTGFKDGVKFGYDILHTGNKPSGSYTGNGSATSRTIDTGGLGGLGGLLVYTGGNVVIVTGGGGFSVNTSTGEIFVFKHTDAAFDTNGVLTLNMGNNTPLNHNGTLYYYQVL